MPGFSSSARSGLAKGLRYSLSWLSTPIARVTSVSGRATHSST